MTENGNHVTWRELNLALKPIHAGQARIEQKVDELHTKYIADENAERERAWLGPRGQTLLTIATKTLLTTAIAAGTAAAVAVLFH